MRRREFIGLLGGAGGVAARRASAAAGDAGRRISNEHVASCIGEFGAAAFRRGLNEAGYSVGQNVATESPLGGGSN